MHEMEGVKDPENFSARITKIRVVVAKISRKEFWGLICNFLKVARAIFGIIFKFWGFIIEIVDCSLISNKDRGSFQQVRVAGSNAAHHIDPFIFNLNST
jgi:hypothetical protein